MDQNVLSKSAILMLALYVTSKSHYPPNISKTGDKVERSTFLNKNVLTLTPFVILWLVVPLMIEFLPTLSTINPGLYADFCPNFRAYQPFNIHVITGSLLMILGACIRLWCYRTLGKFFTFEVTIRPQHKLITSGPYNFLRHPSYAGFFIVCTGATYLAFIPSGALTACGFTDSTGVQIIRAVWFILMFLFCITVVKRVGGEDQNLKMHFGKEWEVYAARVKYTIFPLIY